MDMKVAKSMLPPLSAMAFERSSAAEGT
jgi:hypothetical protein